MKKSRQRPFGFVRFLPFTLFTFILFYTSVLADPTATPTPLKTPTASPEKLPRITVIPNPARGDKAVFRAMTLGPALVRVKIYNRFFDPYDKLEAEGDHLIDIIWSLKNVPEGIYYYQTQIVDKGTGEFTKIPLQRFEVIKDEVPDAKD